MKTLRKLFLLTLLPVLAACATYSPRASIVTGQRYIQTSIDTYPTEITGIDGVSPAFNTTMHAVEPGPHVLSVSTHAFAGPDLIKPLKLDILPCKRYYIVARKQNSLSSDWQPIVDYIEDAGDCRH